VSELTSAAVPAIGPDDRVRGEGPEVVIYMDFGCPRCAAVWAEIRELPLRLCFRHFPLSAKHPRAPALHAAAEAAANQGAFWEMCDSLFFDRGHVDDPHLWERAERFGLDRERFRADSRSDAVAERIRHDFESGISAGVSGTPTAFVGGERLANEIRAKLRELAAGSPGE
jgi:protein-disulfide isomerase